MKFGPIEGTPEEIKGFIQDNGLQVETFFQAHEQPIRNRWFSISAIVVIGSMGALALAPAASSGFRTFVFLVGCSGTVWLASLVQIRFKNAVAAAGIAVAGLLLLLVALGVLRPAELLEQAQKWKTK